MSVPKLYAKQKGMVLILAAFIIGLGAIAYLLNMVSPQQLKLEQDKKTMQNLSVAKAALLSWAVSNSFHLGQFPYPDRKGGGGYDGKSDCPSPVSTFDYAFLIGQLPVYGQTNPCISPQSGLGVDVVDAQGNKLWYAVSRNVVHEYGVSPSDPTINPNIIDNPPYLWLRVLDRNGTMISDRVVAVIIAPGNPLGGQNRTVASSIASDFLDAFNIGATTYSNADYIRPDEDFIVGEDSRNVSSTDTTFTQPYYFNDKLTYITVNELIAALSNRAAAEASSLLRQYKAKTGQFPYAANLGSSLNNHIATPPNQKGMLPIDITDAACTCVSETSCSCGFNPISSVTMYRYNGTWSSAQDNGGCVSTGKECTCSGAGSCARNSTSFVCDAAGSCVSSNLTPSINNQFIYKLPSHADFYNLSGSCILDGAELKCNNSGSFNVGLKEPSWFKDNLWQDYFYYKWSATPSLQVGDKVGISALLVATDKAIVNPPFAIKGSSQNRPSNVIEDYLDSVENTNEDAKFDAVNQPKSANYNDQVYVVSP